MNILKIIQQHGETITSVAAKMGVTRPTLSNNLKKPSYTTLERIASALNVEPWQLLAPPSVVEEVEKARVKSDDFAAFIRLHGKTYTPQTLDELAAVVDGLRGEK